MNLDALRNIGIIAHIDAGKTTFSERILFYSNTIHRMGEVHEGAATMDFLPEEQERGITIASACITCFWNDCVINLVDTPGHVDFTIEVERSLRVLDAAVGIFCAVAGVEPQSETVWRQADSFSLPRIAVINKMDRPGASFEGALASMSQRLGVTPVPVTIPLGEGDDFSAVLDLVRREKVIFEVSSQGKVMEKTPWTPSEAEYAQPWVERLMDAVTQENDVLLEAYLSGDIPEQSLVDDALRQGVLSGRFVPVFAASALRNIGVQLVLDAVCRYLPGPGNAPPVFGRSLLQGKALADEGRIDPDPKGPVCAFVFKVMVAGGRKSAFIRMYRGTLSEGDTLANPRQGVSERCMRLYRLHAGRQEQITRAVAGEILVIQGMKSVQTGDTLTSPGQELLLEDIRVLRPVISLAFEPRNSEEGERLDEALSLFMVEDPTLHVAMDETSGQRIVSGMGELHLEVVKERLLREFGITSRIGNPQVVCHESLKGQASGSGVFDRELGGQPHYGKVSVAVKPAPRGEGVSVVWDMDVSAWQKALVDAVYQGASDACHIGPSGYLADDLCVHITHMEDKEGFATPPGMHMAAQQAVRTAFEQAGSLILEPLMQADINVPDEFLGAVISLLGARGAKVEEIEDRAGQKRVFALSPMRGLFGFSTALRSATQGRAGLGMQFVRFDAL